jgi:murein peptide amidase A
VIEYDDLEARWKALRSRGDIAVREVACESVPRTLLCAESGPTDAPVVTISAGVHGDEPAGVLALLSLFEENSLDPHFAYRLWPCTNPSGYSVGTRVNAEGLDVNRTFARGGGSPEARAIIMANRDRKYELALDLHEDCDAGAFYCYAYNDDGIAQSAVIAVRESGFAVEEDAILTPDPQSEREAIGGMSYSLLLLRNAARRVVTFETPSRLPLEQRVAMHRRAVQAAVEALRARADSQTSR